jgi:hypothetical protein
VSFRDHVEINALSVRGVRKMRKAHYARSSEGRRLLGHGTNCFLDSTFASRHLGSHTLSLYYYCLSSIPLHNHLPIEHQQSLRHLILNLRTFSSAMASMQQQQATAPPQFRAVADFLRSSNAGMKIRTGVLAGKRADYFKGMRRLIQFAISSHKSFYCR